MSVFVAAGTAVRGEATIAPDVTASNALVDIKAAQKTYWLQVRVRQRVIIRIPRIRPSSQAASFGTVSRTPRKKPVRFKEKKIGKCLWANQLAGARPGRGKDEYLEIVTKGRSLIRAYLGRGCKAQQFYAGAYMERAKDGKLCADRDILHARNGAKCEVDKFRLMVPRK